MQEASSQLGIFVGETEETASLDFKSRFDPALNADWCELIKDIVAMANSGGGKIVIGVNDDGSASGQSVASFLALDVADISNKIHKYTENHFSDFQLSAPVLAGQPVATIDIKGVRFPIIFSSPGTYEFGTERKQKTAFGKGTVYFRHGAKSEPGSSDDLRASLERELARVKDFWLKGITQVVEAPPGSEIRIVQPVSVVTENAGARGIRLTMSGDGPEFRVVDNDQLYPHRVKELVQRIRDVTGSTSINSFDIQQVRKHHAIDENPNFSHKGKFGTRQYSEAFIEWLAAEFQRDNQFFQKAREACRARVLSLEPPDA